MLIHTDSFANERRFICILKCKRTRQTRVVSWWSRVSYGGLAPSHPARRMLGCLKAPTFVSMTCGPNRWLAHMSVTQGQMPLRHRSSVHPDTTLVCLVRLNLRMQTNLLSFANESVCITMPVFSLQIISHSKQDTIN